MADEDFGGLLGEWLGWLIGVFTLLGAAWFFSKMLFPFLRDALRANPKLAKALVALPLGCAACLGLLGFWDYYYYSHEPPTATIATAASEVTEGGLWVTLEDAEIHYDKPVRTKEQSSVEYIPITDPNRRFLILVVRQEHDSGRTRVRKPVAGVLKPLSDSVLKSLADNGFDASTFVPSGSRALLLCSACGMDKAVFKFVGVVILAIAGLVIFLTYHERKPKKQAVPYLPGSNRCPGCGLISFSDSFECRRCGSTLSTAARARQ